MISPNRFVYSADLRDVVKVTLPSGRTVRSDKLGRAVAEKKREVTDES